MNNNKNLKSFVKGIMYIAPALGLLLIFNIYPIIKSFDMSFYTRYNYYKDIVYARGLDNFYYIFSDKEFLIAMKNTFYICALCYAYIYYFIIDNCYFVKFKYKI